MVCNCGTPWTFLLPFLVWGKTVCSSGLECGERLCTCNNQGAWQFACMLVGDLFRRPSIAN